jgi:tetratricopeptide (TPR) repeat protein
LIAENPINADYRRGLVLNYQQGGDYRRHSDTQGALEYFRRAVALEEDLLAADPANALIRKDLGYQHKRIADFLANLKDWSQAFMHFSKALEIFEKLASDAPADLISRFSVVACRAGMAAMHARRDEVDLALQECSKATALLGEISEDSTYARQRFNRAQAFQYLGYAYSAIAASPKASASESKQHTSAAREMFQKALNVLDDLRSRGMLDVSSEEWARQIAGEIATCDTALAK